ncbi:UNVERIFIED_CONTAM: hypothetical protein K2H54_020467 [Gekko kuhli]
MMDVCFQLQPYYSVQIYKEGDFCTSRRDPRYEEDDGRDIPDLPKQGVELLLCKFLWHSAQHLGHKRHANIFLAHI